MRISDWSSDVCSSDLKSFRVANDLEVTLEANPTSVEASRLARFRDAGVNRVSLGVQALDAAVLRFLGRNHAGAEALTAVAGARDRRERARYPRGVSRRDPTTACQRDDWSERVWRQAGHRGE